MNVMERPIDVLELSVRPYNCLKRAGVETVGQLMNMSRFDLLKVRNMGHRGIDEISLAMVMRTGVPLKGFDDGFTT